MQFAHPANRGAVPMAKFNGATVITLGTRRNRARRAIQIAIAVIMSLAITIAAVAAITIAAVVMVDKETTPCVRQVSHAAVPTTKWNAAHKTVTGAKSRAPIAVASRRRLLACGNQAIAAAPRRWPRAPLRQAMGAADGVRAQHGLPRRAPGVGSNQSPLEMRAGIAPK